MRRCCLECLIQGIEKHFPFLGKVEPYDVAMAVAPVNLIHGTDNLLSYGEHFVTGVFDSLD